VCISLTLALSFVDLVQLHLVEHPTGYSNRTAGMRVRSLAFSSAVPLFPKKYAEMTNHDLLKEICVLIFPSLFNKPPSFPTYTLFRSLETENTFFENQRSSGKSRMTKARKLFQFCRPRLREMKHKQNLLFFLSSARFHVVKRTFKRAHLFGKRQESKELWN
jgi:hypothetical protein